jgi:hypothetical protein
VDIEDAVQQIIEKHNFIPGKTYNLYRLKEINGKNGGTLEVPKTVHTRTFQLERDPNFGTGLHDLKDKDDFISYFEENYGKLPNGKYAAGTSRGGNDGMAYFFRLRLENGEVVKWWAKSKAKNTRQNSSTYYVLPDYFRIREELGV